MERTHLSDTPRLFLAIVMLALAGTTAHASAINYTVTDLGAGSAQLTTDASGNGIVVAPNGQTAYAFPRTPPAAAGPDIISQLPPLTNAPVWSPMTYGNPNYAYSYFSSGFYRNGLFVGTDNIGVAGHISGANSQVVMSQRQPDGTFGPYTKLWSSPNNLESHGQMAEVVDMNSQNQVLGVTTNPNYGNSPWAPHVFNVYDPTTKTGTDLSTFTPQWQISSAVALDDQGRILLTGILNPANSTGPFNAHSLLLTPDGVSSQPLPVPEPTTLAFLVVSLGGLALYRRCR